MALFNINCNQGKLLCDKNQYKGEASLWDKIKLTFYLIFCSECRSYTADNNKLTKAIKNPKVHNVTKDEKNALKEKIAREMNNQ